MKFLLAVLLIIWLGATVDLAFKNVAYKAEEENQFHRRLYIAFSRTMNGCMLGVQWAKPLHSFNDAYTHCLNAAYEERERYNASYYSGRQRK